MTCKPEFHKADAFSAAAQIKHISDFFGTDFPEDEYACGSAEELIRLSGLLFRPVELDADWWKSSGGVMLCTGTDGRSYAVLPRGMGYYCIGADGRHIAVNGKNADMLSLSALRIYRALPPRRLSVKELWLFLFRSVHRGDVIGLLLISLSASVLGVFIPEITRFVFSSLAPSGSMQNLAGLAVLFAGAVITSELFALSRTVWVAHSGGKTEILLNNAIWDRLLSLPASFFRTYDSGEISHMAEAADTICETLGKQLIPAVLGACFSIVYLIEMGRLVPPLFVPSLVIVVLLLAAQITAACEDSKTKLQNHPIKGRSDGLLYQMLQGRSKLQTAGAEERAFSRWDALFRKMKFRPTGFELFVKCLSATILLGGTIWFYAIAGRQHMSVSSFIASQSAFGLFCGAVTQIASVTSQITALRPAAEMLRPILETEPETSAKKLRAKPLSGEIQLNNVCFRYRDSEKPVLDHLDLHISPGEYLGIAGSTGCGKSTILRIILGLETPQSGTVALDGIDCSRLELRSVRRQIGTVLQDGRLFSGDILSNITISAPGISVDEAWAAAEKSGFAADIRKMPLGMHTILTENGGGLSGGQQQRLLITRALAQNPRILILDEATSALDNRTQSEVVKSLGSLGITRIAVAHRLSTLRACTRIIYMEDGKIVEEGSFDELMQLDGRFAQQAKRQTV